MATPRKLIPFHGGPLDGHRQDVSERTKPLPALLELGISANTYRTLARQPPASEACTTSLAIYELRSVDGAERYCFIAAKKPAGNRTADRGGARG